MKNPVKSFIETRNTCLSRSFAAKFWTELSTVAYYLHDILPFYWTAKVAIWLNPWQRLKPEFTNRMKVNARTKLSEYKYYKLCNFALSIIIDVPFYILIELPIVIAYWVLRGIFSEKVWEFLAYIPFPIFFLRKKYLNNKKRLLEWVHTKYDREPYKSEGFYIKLASTYIKHDYRYE